MDTKSTPVEISPPKLLDQVRDKIRVKHYSIRTEKQYLQMDQTVYSVSQ